MKELLELRRKMKARKPNFVREDSHKKKKLRKSGWRRPKGLHSKIRHQFKGHIRAACMGFRSPNAVRGLSRTGLIQVVVRNVSELKKINPKTEGVIIGNIGLRKRVEIVKEAQILKIMILNLKDSNKFLDDVKKKFEEKKKKKEEEKKKEEKKEAKVEEKKKEEKKEAKEEVTEEDKKKEEKEEKDKVLTKRK